MERVNLGHLAPRLGEAADWSRVLSIGEQQRLAFARVLYNRPAIVFLDEATSATDEGLEHALYRRLRADLPEAMLVSVGHRGTLDAFHSHRLELDGTGRWSMGPMEETPRREAASMPSGGYNSGRQRCRLDGESGMYRNTSTAWLNDGLPSRSTGCMRSWSAAASAVMFSARLGSGDRMTACRTTPFRPAARACRQRRRCRCAIPRGINRIGIFREDQRVWQIVGPPARVRRARCTSPGRRADR